MEENGSTISSLPSDLWEHIGFYLTVRDLLKVNLLGNSSLSTRLRHGIRNCSGAWNRRGFANVSATVKATHQFPNLHTLDITLEDYQRAENPIKWERSPSFLRTLRLQFAHCVESLCSLYDLDTLFPTLEVLDLTNTPVASPLVYSFSLRKLPPRLWALHLRSPHPSSRIDLTDTSNLPTTLETLEIDFSPLVEAGATLAFGLPQLRALRLNLGDKFCKFDVNSLPSTLTSLILVPLDGLEDINWTEKFPDLQSLVLLPPRSTEGHRLLAHEDDQFQDWTDRHTLLVAPESKAPITPDIQHLRGILIDDITQIPIMYRILSLSVPGVWNGTVELPQTLIHFEASYICTEALSLLPSGVQTITCSAILGIEKDKMKSFLESLETVFKVELKSVLAGRDPELLVRRLFPNSLTKLTCTEYAVEAMVLEHLPSSIKELDVKVGWKSEFWFPMMARRDTLPNLTYLRDRSPPETSLPSISILPPSLTELNIRLSGLGSDASWPFSSDSSTIHLPHLTRLSIPSGEIPHQLFGTFPRSLLHLHIGSIIGTLSEHDDPIHLGVKQLPPDLLSLAIGSFVMEDLSHPEISEEAALALPKSLRSLQIETKLTQPLGLLRGIRLGTSLILIGNDITIYKRRCQDSVPLEAGYTDLFPTSNMYC